MKPSFLRSFVSVLLVSVAACRSPDTPREPLLLECRASAATPNRECAPDPCAAVDEPSSSLPPRTAERALEARQAAGAESWTWRLVPYFFAANMDGTLSVGNTEVSTDVSFGDLLQNLDLGGFLLFEGRRGRWGFAIDGAYIDLGEDGKGPAGVAHEADIKMGILGATALWSVAPDSPYELALGLRYLDFEQDLEVGATKTNGSSQLLDGVGGGRATWPFAERWRVGLYGDVGAGDSDLTWQALANLGYDFDHWGLNLGYRVLAYDFEDGPKSVDVALEGWVFGVEFRF